MAGCGQISKDLGDRRSHTGHSPSANSKLGTFMEEKESHCGGSLAESEERDRRWGGKKGVEDRMGYVGP